MDFPAQARLAAAVLLVWVGPLAAAPACTARSGPLVRPVVELFTSEGCDSCPPADRWLSASFKDAREGPVALAFHVDYWDRLGWKDRFAQALYTERQQKAADANHAAFVYTPQVLLQGRDFRWRDADAPGIAQNATPPAQVIVDLALERDATGVRARAVAHPAGATPVPGDTAVVLAYVDNDLSSDVKAGENRGARLHHDHVVRALHSGAVPDGRGGVVAEATLALPAEAGRDPAIVAFAQRSREGAILQSVLLPLADCPPR